MNLGNAVLVFALVVMLVVAVFFVFCRRYEEGIGGNIALGLLAIVCGVLLCDVLRGTFEPPSPAWTLVIVCAAYLLMRHAYRFAMFHWHGAFGWSRPRDHDHDATVPLGMKRQRGSARLALMPALASIALLAACATTKAEPAAPVAPRTFSGIWALKGIGQSEEGVTFVLAHCEEKK